MEAQLLVDHHPVENPNAPVGMIVRVLLTLTGTAPADPARPPIALAFVLDRSGSMSGDRIIAARTAAARAVERLHPDDVVSVVAFDDAVQTVARPAPRHKHAGLVNTLLGIDVRGSTNLSGGWLRGRQHMERALGMLNGHPGASRRIVLLTDGQANQGITDPATLIELARTARALGITTTTVGVGEGYDDALLRGMADAGGGNAWYVERPDQAHDVMHEELGNLLSVAAQGLTVTLELGPDVQMVAVHSDWPTVQPAAGVLEFDLGDLYAAEPKPVLLELLVPNVEVAPGASPRAIGQLTVEGDVILSKGAIEHRTLHFPIAATFDQQSLLMPDIEKAVLLARTAQAREEAARRQREGDAQGATFAMEQAAANIASSPLAADEAFAAEFAAEVGDLEALAERYATHQHSELDAKYQMQRSYNAKRGKRSYDGTLRRRPSE